MMKMSTATVEFFTDNSTMVKKVTDIHKNNIVTVIDKVVDASIVMEMPIFKITITPFYDEEY